MDPVLERVEHAFLHLQYLFSFVGVVSEIDEVVDDGRVNLLVLARDDHRCHTDKLQLASFDLSRTEESICEVDRQKQGLWQHLKLPMYFDEPVA